MVDDGSIDDTLEVARSYGNAVTAIAQFNQGSQRRNRGLAQADQPIIAFLDADDRLVRHKLERQFQSLSQHPDAMLCICRVCDFWSPDMPQNKRRAQQPVPHFRPGQSTTWLARRELFESVGSFSPPQISGSPRDRSYTPASKAAELGWSGSTTCWSNDGCTQPTRPPTPPRTLMVSWH